MSGRDDWTAEDWDDFHADMELEAQEAADSEHDDEDTDETDDRHYRSAELSGWYGR